MRSRGAFATALPGHYGEDSVFMDIDSIPIGLDFRDQVKKALMSNDIVLAIIGPKWLGAARGAAARIHEEADPVRMEIETALQRGIPVIPVLVGGATLPKSTELPEGLKDLSFRNAADVSTGRDFNQHIERLLRSMDRIVETRPGDATLTDDARVYPRSGEARESEPQSARRNALAPGVRELDAALRPGTGASPSSLMTRVLVPLGLRFADPALEQRFGEHFRERFFWVARTAMGAAILGWVLFGPVDLWSPSGGVESTRFRFMLAAPLMVIYFGLSFTALAQKLWQQFLTGFVILGVSCMTFALTLVTPESWFHFEQASMAFMIFFAFVAIAPFTTVYMVGVGVLIVAVYFVFLAMYGGALLPIYTIFCSLMVVSVYIIACIGAYTNSRDV